MKNCILLILFVIFPSVVNAEMIYLTEPHLKRFLQQHSPSVEQIEASFLAVQNESLTLKDKLTLRLDAKGQLYHSKEKLLNNFDGGVISNSTLYSVKLVKPTRYGLDMELQVFGNKTSNAFVNDATTSGAAFGLSIDLFKDFLGRQTNRSIKRSDLAVERAMLEKKSRLKTFESNVRKIYWSVVANNEKKKLVHALIQTAEKQYQEALLKQKSGAADQAVVSRFHSVLTSRKADLYSLEYREVELLKGMKELLPQLNYQNVKLGRYNTKETIREVMSCTETISSYKASPFENTVYDEIVDLLNQEETLETKVLSSYNAPDIKLNGQISTIGRGFGYNQSQDDLFNNGQPRSQVELNVSIPIGSSKTKSKKSAQLYQKKLYQSKAQANLAKIDAYHNQTTQLVHILKGVIMNQVQTKRALKQSHAENRLKYKQARIGLEELISEQEALLQAELAEIDTNLAIVHTLIDYFSIYMETPCKFNSL